MFLRCILGLCLFLAGTPAVLASPFGAADGHSIFALGDARVVSTRLPERVAAGGTLYLNKSRFGTALTADDLAANRNSIVAQGELTMINNTVVTGDIRHGAAAALNRVQFDDDSSTVALGKPIDFATAAGELSALSDQLAGYSTTGSTDFANRTYMLTGQGDLSLEVFTIDLDAQRNKARTIALTNIDPDATVVVNVTGENWRSWGMHAHDQVTFKGEVFENFLSLATASQVVFNFVDMTELKFENFKMFGTVLASDAEVIFKRGRFTGAAIVQGMNAQNVTWGDRMGGFTGSFDQIAGLVSNDGFGGGTNSIEGEVPTPAALGLMLAGAALIRLRCKRPAGTA